MKERVALGACRARLLHAPAAGDRADLRPARRARSIGGTTLSRQRRVVALAAVDAHGRGRARRAKQGSRAPGRRPVVRRQLRRRLQPRRSSTAADRRSPRDATAASARGDPPGRCLLRGRRDLAGRRSLDLGTERRAGPRPTCLRRRRDHSRRGERSGSRSMPTAAPGEPPVPWIVTNWVGPYPSAPLAPVPPAARCRSLFRWRPAWRVEHEPASSGRVLGRRERS